MPVKKMGKKVSQNMAGGMHTSTVIVENTTEIPQKPESKSNT